MEWTDGEGNTWTGRELAAKIRGVGRLGRGRIHRAGLFCAAGLLAYSKEGEYVFNAARQEASGRLGGIYYARHQTSLTLDNDLYPSLSPESLAEYMAQRFDQLDEEVSNVRIQS